jgi:catechol 2,3-dioxygenase-like lactoylglutathione lyase family enzyme
MFDHISFGVTDLMRSVAFYDAVLLPLGINRMFTIAEEGIAGYRGADGCSFWIYAKTTDQGPLLAIPDRPRFHLAFRAADRPAIDAFYQAALAHGGHDAGPPGLRPNYHPHYYAAFVTDGDGYKLEAVCHQAP